MTRPRIRQLVTTLQGQGQNFDGMNLAGINLNSVDGANLQDASFIGANLNNATLQNADLSRAILKQVQLDGADLTGATLTGACIEDWGITGDTCLDEVKCQYVFMRCVKQGDPDQNPHRKPDNWEEVFEAGDFADFIKPIVDTLDLYHNRNVDPRSIAIAFKNLAENNPDAELQIVAMEKRGKDKFLLRAKASPDSDKSKLSQEYFPNYNQLRALPEDSSRLLLSEKDERIRSLESMIQTALKQPKFYAETYQHQGDVMPENSGINVNAGGNIGDISGLVGGDVSGVVNLGEISGNVTNTISQLPASLDPQQPGIKELLLLLKEAIDSDTNLPEKGKATALEQINVLADVAQNPDQPEKKSLGQQSINFFKNAVSFLPDTAKLADACSKLLPMLSKLLGI